MGRRRRVTLILMLVLLFVVASCATLRGGVTLNNVTKDYQTAQKAYTAVQQLVRQAYLNDLIDDAKYLKFINDVDKRAMSVDKLIVKTLKAAEKLEGPLLDVKLREVLSLIGSLTNITTEAEGYKK